MITEICQVSESIQKQMKIVGDKPELPVNAISRGKFQPKKKGKNYQKKAKNAITAVNTMTCLEKKIAQPTLRSAESVESCFIGSESVIAANMLAAE